VRRGITFPALFIALVSLFGSEALGESELSRHAGAVDESYPGHVVRYDQISNAAGNRIRLITTSPSSGGSFATIFVVGWLSCDTVEAPAGTTDATSLVFRRLAALPDFALIRMEKEGVGDSEGDCAKTDFQTELDDYRAAFQHALAYPFVDAHRVFMFGISNGGGFAPLVSGDTPVAGYVIDGGWLKTWFEHMMEIERRRLVLAGKSQGEINALMQDVAHFYARYLLAGETPREIFKSEPALARIWSERDVDHQYGRPVVYYQQLQKLNLAQTWTRVSAPSLILHGQYDWVMSIDDLRIMNGIIATNSGGASRLVSLPDTGHTFEHYASAADAFAGRELPFAPATADIIANWLEAAVGNVRRSNAGRTDSGKR
jgi:pimeloyl-ACP methyl ester carboxylesterase